MVVAAKSCGLIREGGLCWEWPLREGPLYTNINVINVPVDVMVHTTDIKIIRFS